jgi:hypothetical protein
LKNDRKDTYNIFSATLLFNVEKWSQIFCAILFLDKWRGHISTLKWMTIHCSLIPGTQP